MILSNSAHKRGFTLLEIMIVVCIIGLLVGMAFPAFMKSRNQARKQACLENISQIESAKQQWGIEAGKKSGDVPGQADLIGTDRYIKIMPACPGGGTYDFQPIGTTATCTEAGHVLD
ncbi:MAG TPA: prepilin-type N-terminal cleavage/methylation domain-containing protein [Verrucomicrobiae bacterium]|jgi:prepilin-type N-terminal cleavage/methylation domain-containing protein